MPEIKITGNDIDVLAGSRLVLRNSILADALASDADGVCEIVSNSIGCVINPGEIEVDDWGGLVINNSQAAQSVLSAMASNVASAADTNYVACGANYNCKPK